MREWQARGDALVIMDYPGLHAFAFHYNTEALLIAGLKNYASAQLTHGVWIRPQNFAVEAFMARNPGFGEWKSPGEE